MKTLRMSSPDPVVLTIEPRHEWYEPLCDFVDLESLTFDFSRPPEGWPALRVSSPSAPFLMQLVLQGVYLESDFHIDPFTQIVCVKS
jgi:hypothetical protein